MAALAVVGLSLGACTSDESSQEPTAAVESQNETLPTRPAEVNGNVRSIEGTEVIIANELKEQLSEEEQTAQKEARQAMTQEERQAARADQMELVETESVTLIIPVGVPIYKASGTGDGSTITAELSEITADTYVSLWLENDQVTAVKIKGIN